MQFRKQFFHLFNRLFKIRRTIAVRKINLDSLKDQFLINLMKQINPPDAHTAQRVTVIRIGQMGDPVFLFLAGILPILIGHLDRNLNGR